MPRESGSEDVMSLPKELHPREKHLNSLPLKTELRPVLNLKNVFEICHNYIYANEGLRKEQVFNEVLNLIFLKMVDEQSDSPRSEFGITQAEERQLEKGNHSSFSDRINQSLERAKKKFGDVFSENERINLKPLTLAFLVRQLQEYSFVKTPTDVKGTAFQTFVYPHARGDRGEFFTPHPVVELCIGMLNPKENETVIDPACGSGTFLVETMKHVWRAIDVNRRDLSFEARREVKIKYSRTYIRGIDFNPDLAKVSKMYMILFNDGHTGIFSTNSLYSFDIIDLASKKAGAGELRRESFDIVLTNPPFGTRGKITDKRILEQFELGHQWKWDRRVGRWYVTKELIKGQIPEVLFIERCLQLLKNRGRMAIVLPDGELTNPSYGYIRQFILNQARVLAVVSLPPEAFIPYGASTKASVLFLQKLSQQELDALKNRHYPVFMTICEKIGHDKRGNVILKRDGKGRLMGIDGSVVSHPEQAKVDTDIPDIIKAFDQFKNKHRLGF